MKIRIRHYDRHNWTVERHRPAGQLVSGLGKTTKEGWTVTGYHPTLKRACLDALTELIPIGSTDQEIVDSLAQAQEAICRALARASVDFLSGKVSEVMVVETPPNPRAERPSLP